MPNHPLTGARLGEQNDAPLGGLYLAQVVNQLSPYTIVPFANAATRDAAYAAWVQAGNQMRDGLLCYMLTDGRIWRYSGGRWGWPNAAQGIVAAPAARLTQAGPVAQAAGWVTVEGLSATFTIPSRRSIKMTFDAEATSNVAGTLVGAGVYNTANQQGKHKTVTIGVANNGEPITVIDEQSLNAGSYTVVVRHAWFGGGGSAYLTAQKQLLLIEDMGAA